MPEKNENLLGVNEFGFKSDSISIDPLKDESMCPFELEIEEARKRRRAAGESPVGYVAPAFVSSWSGIILAGMLYPVLIYGVGMIFVVFGILIGQNSLPSVLDVFGGLLALMLMLGVAAVFGGFIAMFASVIVGMALTLIDWSLGFVLSPRTATVCCGGLSGLVSTTPLFALDDHLIFGLFGPLLSLLAMMMGYIGAVWMAYKIDPQLFVLRSVKQQVSYQFQIRHMLVATAWFAVLFAIDRFNGQFFFSKLFSAWAVVIGVLLVIDSFWLKMRRH